jgi:antitoxin PrlF
MLATSKLTSKFQATVPANVRQALGLDTGDLVGFEVVGTQVRLLRVRPLDLAFMRAMESTLPEWSSEKDDIAFKDL